MSGSLSLSRFDSLCRAQPLALSFIFSLPDSLSGSLSFSRFLSLSLSLAGSLSRFDSLCLALPLARSLFFALPDSLTGSLADSQSLRFSRAAGVLSLRLAVCIWGIVRLAIVVRADMAAFMLSYLEKCFS